MQVFIDVDRQSMIFYQCWLRYVPSEIMFTERATAAAVRGWSPMIYFSFVHT